MSWLFSQALVAEFSEATSWDGAPSSPLSVMPTPHKFWRNDKTMEPSDLSRFGLTCAPLTEDRGEALLTWFREGSLARTSALPVVEQALMAPDRVCGATWRASFARWTPSASMWKTAQPSLFGGSDEYLETWPRWGLMLNGESFLQPTPALPICVSESGFWPTPTVCGNYNRPGVSANSGMGLASAVKLWPTPTASLGSKGGRVTPRKSREGGTLIEAVSARAFATPTARDWRSGKASQEAMERNSRPLSEQIGGLLNPAWVEWLMGWPIGWTELKPLAMDKFHEWQQQHSICFAGKERAE